MNTFGRIFPRSFPFFLFCLLLPWAFGTNVWAFSMQQGILPAPENAAFIQPFPILDDGPKPLVFDDFSARRVLSGKVLAKMPKNFRRMGREAFYRHFPTKNYENYEAYTNDAGTMTLAFEHLPIAIRPGMIHYYRQQYHQQFNAQPGVEVSECTVIEMAGNDALHLEMTTTTTEVPALNLMRIIADKNRMLVVSFHCQLVEAEKFRPTGIKMVNSIKMLNN